MKTQNIAYGSVGAIAVLIFLLFVLRGCTRNTASAQSSATGQSFSGSSTEPCDADTKTGICYPQEKHPYADYDHDDFMAMVRTQAASSAVSSGQDSFAGTSSGSEYVSTSEYSSGYEYAYAYETSSEVRMEESGEWSVSSETEVAEPGSGTETTVVNDPPVYRHSGACRNNASFLAIFDDDQKSLGRTGWTFPVLVNGDCPITAAMLKGPSHPGSLGGPLNDF